MPTPPLAACGGAPITVGSGKARGPRLARHRVVPNLREDLVVTRAPEPLRFAVADPAGGEPLTLHEVELAVARMLDGRRTVAEVIENADQLGIPVDLAGLSRFLLLLDERGFLAPPGTIAGQGASARPPRRSWDPRVRDQFRMAMKLVRTGQPAVAAPLLRAIAAQDPENVEAREALALLEAGETIALSVGELFARPASPRRPGRSGLVLAAALVLLAVATAAALRLAAT